ncbi:MFS transporter [Myxosarcina sp. GI1(2024)]
MTQNIDILSAVGWLAQAPGIEIEPSGELLEDAALVNSGPNFFAALVAGVMLAFAFQLLFTNLGVATVISSLGGKSDRSNHSDSESLGGTVKKISVTLGIATLISVTLALFIASILAVKLSLFESSLSGVIVGLAIWATFFSLMVWLSSTAVGSFLGSIVHTATSGLQSIIGTATAAIGAAATGNQVVNTAEAAAAAVRKELGKAIDPNEMRENVEDFLHSVRGPELDLQQIATDFEQLLDDENLQEIVNSESLSNIDLNTFVELISARSDISARDARRIATKLESVWQKTLNKLPSKSSNPLTELANYLKVATREQLTGSDLDDKLDQLIGELRRNRQAQSSGPIAQGMSMGFHSLVGLVMGRADLSDVDVDTIVDRLQSLKDELGVQTEKVAMQTGIKKPSQSTIKADIENYLNNAYPWQLKPSNLNLEFRDLIYDPEADPEVIANELRKLHRSDFVELLEAKGMLTKEQIKEKANLLDAIRLEVLATAEAAAEREKTIALMAEVERYLTTVSKEELSLEKLEINFKPILEDNNATREQIENRLRQLDRPTFERMLEIRGDLDAVEISTVSGELEIIRDRVLQEFHETLGKTQAKAERQWLKIQSYLRETGREELNPQAIERELNLLLKDPQAGASALRARLAQFDRATLVELLSRREDLSEEKIEEIIDSVENVWFQIRHTPQMLAGKAQEQYARAESAIADYLRSTGKAELNPRGIKRDLALLLEDPQLGTKAIRQRLAAMDRDTLVKLLTQRNDLTEEEVNQVIDEVQENLRSLAKLPRRLAVRTQKQVTDFQTALADYLRSTDKEELNPEGIQHDVELLLNDPRAGMESLKERLAHFDRSTLVALLSQREDISEEDVNRIVDQILAVRDRALAQLQTIQSRIQSIIDRVLAKIRTYLNSLDRPELNYEGVERDIRILFDDPQAGFEALKDRFSQIDRDTLVAVMSSRDDISRTDAERIVGRIERTRDRALQRAERIQYEAQRRLELAKIQAQQQVEHSRKAAAAASWWLFFTALVSGIAAAVGGGLGVVG